MIDRSDIEEVLKDLGILFTRYKPLNGYYILKGNFLSDIALFIACASVPEDGYDSVALYECCTIGTLGNLIVTITDPFDLQQWLIDEFEKYAN